MMLRKLRPTRTAQQESTEVKILCDFDSILSQSVGFKFQGKVYEVKPVDVENYMKVTLAYQELLQMTGMRSQGVQLIEDEIFVKYYNLIHPLVPDFSYDTLKKLPFALLNKLVNLIFKQLAGDPEIYGQSDEKKNPQIPKPSKYDSLQ